MASSLTAKQLRYLRQLAERTGTTLRPAPDPRGGQPRDRPAEAPASRRLRRA